MRQLRARQGEEDEHECEPEQQIGLQIVAPYVAYALRHRHEQRRERQTEEQHDGKVVEQAAAMARDRAAEAADVVLEEEALDEAAAFLEQDGDVPGKRDRKQEKE